MGKQIFYRIPCQIESDFLLILKVFPVTGKTLYSVHKKPCELPLTLVNICSALKIRARCNSLIEGRPGGGQEKNSSWEHSL